MVSPHPALITALFPIALPTGEGRKKKERDSEEALNNVLPNTVATSHLWLFQLIRILKN